MTSLNHDLSNSSFARHCPDKQDRDTQICSEAFLMRRGYDHYLSFFCLELICQNAWTSENNRPKSINKLERDIDRDLKDTDMWAILYHDSIISSVEIATQQIAARTGIELLDLHPFISPETKDNLPSHVGLHWDTSSLPVPLSILDLAIANNLAISVDDSYHATRKRRKRK